MCCIANSPPPPHGAGRGGRAGGGGKGGRGGGRRGVVGWGDRINKINAPPPLSGGHFRVIRHTVLAFSVLLVGTTETIFLGKSFA